MRLICWQAKPVYGVRGEAHGGGKRLRACEQTGSIANVITGQSCGKVGGSQREQAHDHCEQCLRHAVCCDAAHELRPDPVADGKQEDQEEYGLDVCGDGDVELSDDDRGDQGGGHDAQAEPLPALAAHVIANGQRHEDGDLRIGSQCRHDPVHRDHPLVWLAAAGRPVQAQSGEPSGAATRQIRGAPSDRPALA